MRTIWKRYVWRALRSQDCRDLVEYYDYNSAIDEHIRRLRLQVVAGTYRPTRSLMLELNKSDKLVRRVEFPNPDDALVLQTLTESVLPLSAANELKEKVFFSRSHSNPKGIHTIQVGATYPWFKLWKKYQREILSFSQVRKYLVITDIQNYFESITHAAVDRSLTRIGVSQPLRDLISYMLESFVFRERYLPLVRKGVPQLNFDAPYLLAHILLFSVDTYVNRKTQGSYARWVDDINFGVDTKAQARELLRAIERFLARIELRLNGSKTVILSRPEAEEYLHVTSNLKLTNYDNELNKPNVPADLVEQIYIDFLYFTSKPPSEGHWDQVYRRYVGLATRVSQLNVGSPTSAELKLAVDERIREGFEKHTDYRNRKTLIRYWESQSVTDELSSFLMKQLTIAAVTDDVIACLLGRALISANLSDQAATMICEKIDGVVFAESMVPHGDEDAHIDHEPEIVPLDRYGLLVAFSFLLAKYGNSSQIDKFIRATKAAWSVSDFFARQVIAIWSILDPSAPNTLNLQRFITANVQRGPLDLNEYFLSLRQLSQMPAGLEGYVSPANMTRPYTLSKAVVASNLLRSLGVPNDVRARLKSALDKIPDLKLRAIALNTLHK